MVREVLGMQDNKLSLKHRIRRDRKGITEFCKKCNKIYVYGTGDIAKRITELLKTEEIVISAYIVTNGMKKQEEYMGKKVYELGEIILADTDGIIVAVDGRKQPDVMETLNLSNLGNVNIYLQKSYFLFNGEEKKEEAYKGEVSKTSSFFHKYKELDAVGTMYLTDKRSGLHNYLNKYEFFLRGFKEQEITLLELGVYRGASLKMWGEYFKNARIIGVDIDENCLVYAGGNREVWIRDMELFESINDLRKLTPNIIVDDASHLWSHQIKSLILLFASLQSGGIYIIEDIENSFPNYAHLCADDAVFSTYEFLEAVSRCVAGYDVNCFVSGEIAEFRAEIDLLASEIECMSFIKGSCVIVKK